MKAFFHVSCIDDGLAYVVPHDEPTTKYISRRKANEVIVAEIKLARNYEQHKRYFSFLNFTFDNQDHFEEFEAYRKWLALKAGFFTTLVEPNGNIRYIVDSISFESMDEDVFEKLFSVSIDVFLKNFGGDMTQDELLQAVSYA